MIDEPRHTAAGAVDDQTPLELHEIVAVHVLVDLAHAALAFGLGDDFAGVFHDDLTGGEGATAADAEAAGRRFDDFDADVEGSAAFDARGEGGEGAIGALVRWQRAVG